jgi:DNA-binding NtrC family response regulator
LSLKPALVVEPGLGDMLALVPILTGLGFEITATENFEEAKQSLRVPPRLLVTEIRLGEFNGLHLVLRGRSARHNLSAIVTSTVDDPVLRHEAEALGATFLLKPVSARDLEAAIVRTLLATETPVHEPFERRQSDRRANQSGAPVIDRRGADRRTDARVRIAQLPPN